MINLRKNSNDNTHGRDTNEPDIMTVTTENTTEIQFVFLWKLIIQHLNHDISEQCNFVP